MEILTSWGLMLAIIAYIVFSIYWFITWMGMHNNTTDCN